MKAVQVTRFGSPSEVIEVREIDVPAVGAGEVLVAVTAASINFGDIARTRGGVATVRLEPPFTLGMDVCGTVETAGTGAEHLVGRRVVANAKMSFGGMAERAVCAMNGVFDAPPSLTDAAATGFLLPYHTSYLALHQRARMQAGEHVVITGAASGVGTAALRLAVAAGANVIALVGSDEHASFARAQGAATTVNYRSADVFEAVLDATGDHGADVALDLVGGDLTDALWTCMASEGRYLPVGFNDDPGGGLGGKPLRKVSTGNFSVLGVMLSYNNAMRPLRKMGMQPYAPTVGREIHAALCDLIASGSIEPTVERLVKMHDVGATLQAHEERRTTGRSVVDIAAG